MRRSLWALVILPFGLLAGACEKTNPVGPTEFAATNVLLAALRQQGAAVERGDVLPQRSNPFFTANAQIIYVNSGLLNVFEYPTVAAADVDAAKVSPDGSSVGVTVISWIGPPHFYRSGRVIAIYAGSDDAVLRPLEAVLGKPFAAR